MNDEDRTFVNKLFNFTGVGLALYVVASIYEWASSDSIIKLTVKCKYCRKRISQKER
jgi:large conductance mechanosensitive channel